MMTYHDTTIVFRFFITDSIADQMVLHTNMANQKMLVGLLVSVKIRPLIGMLIITGTMKQNMVDIDMK